MASELAKKAAVAIQTRAHELFPVWLTLLELADIIDAAGIAELVAENGRLRKDRDQFYFERQALTVEQDRVLLLLEDPVSQRAPIDAIRQAIEILKEETAHEEEDGTLRNWSGAIQHGENRTEWQCKHGVGHGNHVHGCDGCCKRDDYPGRTE